MARKLANGRIEIEAAPANSISIVFDRFKNDGGPALSVEEINEVARRGWSGKRES